MEGRTFEELYKLDVRDKVEQKNGLNYLSWAYAWAEIKKNFEDAYYEIEKFENNLPYVYDENTGYMVFTKMRINGIEHEMWLPVMDAANMPMMNYDYQYETKKGVKECKKATMFDINKTIMRCLTKNIAMYGLGLSLYQGEDLPAVTTKEEAEKVVITFGKYQGKMLQEIFESDRRYFEWLRENSKDENVRAAIELIDKTPSQEEQKEIFDLIKQVSQLLEETGTDREKFYGHYKVSSNNEMTKEQLQDAVINLKKKAEKVVK